MSVLASRCPVRAWEQQQAGGRSDWRYLNAAAVARVCTLDSLRCRAWEHSSTDCIIITSSSSSSRQEVSVHPPRSLMMQRSSPLSRQPCEHRPARAAGRRYDSAGLPPTDINNGYRQLYSDRPARNKLYGTQQRAWKMGLNIISREARKAQYSRLIPQLQQQTQCNMLWKNAALSFTVNCK